MSDRTPTLTPDTQEPFIPPRYLLLISGAAFLVAVIVAATQAEFGVVGFGALALGVLALLGWALMAPDEARALLTGRTVRYGGLGVVVTVVFLTALVLLYVLVRNQNLRADLTRSDDFSLSEASREAVTTLGADPTVPTIELVAFYGAQQAGGRDRDAVLLEDYAATSGGKIRYRFVDPDRNPAIAEQYGVTRNGQIAVAPLDESGQPLLDEAETVNFFSQDELTNAILKVSARGDFRAYVLRVEDGVSVTPGSSRSMSIIADLLRTRFDWTVEEISFLDLMRSDSTIDLDEPSIDGRVLVIPGGASPLAEQELDFLRDYVAGGGDLILLAQDSFNAERESLATDPALGDFLFETFGLRFRDDVVIDPVQYTQDPGSVVTNSFDGEHFITSNLSPDTFAIMTLSRSIELAETPPSNVTVTPIVQSSETAYAKTDFDAALEGDIAQAEGDLEGPLVLGAVAENAATGARVVAYGSTAPVEDGWVVLQQGGVANLELIMNTLVWETDFSDFFQRTNIMSAQRPEDTPIFASDQQVRTLNFITLILLPFGVLAIGILVWWNNRERARAPR